MANPYHDENGKFCSKTEMQGAVDRLVSAGSFKEAIVLRGSFEHINKEREIEEEVAFHEARNARRMVRAERAGRSPARQFFASEEELNERRVSKNSSTAVEELINMSKSSRVITRIGVAANVSAPETVLNQLAKDKDWGVRAAVAKNTSTNSRILKVLADDENNWVRDEADLQLNKR